MPQKLILGVQWCPIEDVFKFQVNQCTEKNNQTKRNFLSKIATLFDPLGLLSPYIVRAKDWDEPVGVASRSRVAPHQAISIPHLSLMAAVAGLRLGETVGQVLVIEKHEWAVWSDSMDVLYWICGQSRKYKPFVSNRVGEIQAFTNPEQ